MKIKKMNPWRNTAHGESAPVDTLLQPESVEELQQALRETAEPCYVIGGGSNLLVSDKGIAGTVIQLGGSLCGLTIEGDTITAEAGVPLPLLAHKAAEHSLSGLEFAAGIPGTVGGAVVMNAGAYQSQISNVVQQVTCCDRQGNLIVLEKEDCAFAYRNSRFKQTADLVIVAVTMQLLPGQKEDILAQMQKNTVARNEKQPVEYPSAGSIFKNPAGDAAGRLVESVGVKGWKQGGAMVSEKHSNFIVNTGNATCADVLQLIERVKQAVKTETGVQLEEEILLLGE